MYVGIDLGTSNSAIAGMNDGKVRIFKTPEGTDTMPSAIHRDRRGNQTIGVRAYDLAMLAPENAVDGFKRLMGTDTPLRFGSTGESITPEQAASEILRSLVGYAMMEAGANAISGAVVTIPAAFNQMQSEATLSAARKAGLERVALIQEPVAAALAAMAGAQNRSGLFLVYDFGGGTFDTALVHAVDGEVTVLAHEGVNMLGGRDLDRGIVETLALPWLRSNFDLPADFAINPRYQRLVRIARRSAEIAKIGLSTRDSAVLSASDDEVRVDDLGGNPIYIDVPIARHDIETLGAEAVTRSIECCRKMLADVGYRHEDIGRIVLIGGPTKMPFLRRRVQEELGIQIEDATRVDPMTAVAAGAAIYCEGRDWTADGSSAKVIRRTESAGQFVSVSFDYDTRTASDRARLTVRQVAGPAGAEVLVDSTVGWSSQRRKLTQPVVLDLPLQDVGPNRFRATVFNANGMPVSEACCDIVIDRLLASTGGVPATQTIAAKILTDKGENTLDVMVHKGTLLPATGVVRYRLAAPLRAGAAGQIRIELYQLAHEAVLEPTLNLMVGEFQINADELPEASSLRRGDEVIIHWFMSEGQEITAEVELPSVSQRFSRRKFYNWQLALQDFSGSEGTQLVTAHIERAETDLGQAEEVLPPANARPLPQIRRRLDDQLVAFRGTVDPETRRQVAEDVRLLRQEIAMLCHQPDAQKEIIRRRLASEAGFYDRFVRQGATKDQTSKVDTLARGASAAIDRGGNADLELAKDMIRQIDRLYWSHGFEQIDFCIGLFKHQRQNRYLATDPLKFESLIAEGDTALASGDGETVRRVLFELLANQKRIGPDTRLPERAWLMRA